MPHQTNTTTDIYILQPPDEVEIFCEQYPKIHQKRQQIRPDGKISFEEIGEIPAAGLTPSQLAENIRLKIVQLFRLNGVNSIDVRISAYRSKVYYVLGQVHAPGPRLYTGRDTVLTAISQANPNPMAWLERIQVIRPSSNPNFRPAIFEFNYDRMIAHGDMTKNVLLQEGDVVYVPPTVLGWLSLKIEEFIRPIARAFSGVYITRRGIDSNQGNYPSYSY